jgi:predicted DCC family thiol-disulfide oxidoreductase YuxK
MAESVHVVAPDGSTWHGAGAAEQLAHLLPGGWPLALLFRVPLVRRCADGIYRRVARTRTSSGCEIRPLP